MFYKSISYSSCRFSVIISEISSVLESEQLSCWSKLFSSAGEATLERTGDVCGSYCKSTRVSTNIESLLRSVVKISWYDAVLVFINDVLFISICTHQLLASASYALNPCISHAAASGDALIHLESRKSSLESSSCFETINMAWLWHCSQVDVNPVLSDGSEELPDGRPDLHDAAGEL